MPWDVNPGASAERRRILAARARLFSRGGEQRGADKRGSKRNKPESCGRKFQHPQGGRGGKLTVTSPEERDSKRKVVFRGSGKKKGGAKSGGN